VAGVTAIYARWRPAGRVPGVGRAGATARQRGNPDGGKAEHSKEKAVALTWIRTHDWDAEAWRGRSACRDSDPDVFFPIGTTGSALEQIETARRICTACLVNDECLEFALATNQEAGIWGGTTEEERRKLRKAWVARQRAAC
jgi:WhiB family transcriptional regulator, redox-sensing transcriptional regulator